MLAHMIDHFIFTSRRFSEKTKWIAFGVTSFTIIACFWWWKGVAFGIDGPIREHWGLQWRKVRTVHIFLKSSRTEFLFSDLEYL